jgi:signal transduction histidine kinase/HAMP domain-containing protein
VNRARSLSLGAKLNLALLTFLLVLGVATAALILYGFNRTQNNATETSTEGLEESGQETMLVTAQAQAGFGVLQMQWASDAGQLAARYIYDLKDAGASVPAASTALTRVENGILYDPDPARSADVVMPAFAQLTEAARQDIVDGKALDAIAPSIFAGYVGRARGSNFDAIAFYYASTNHVHRYYPPIGVHSIADPATDISPVLEGIGPTENPERKTRWTTPYDDEAGQGLVMTAYTPVYEGEVLRGVIGIDLSLANLVEQVDMVKPSAAGFSFYQYENGGLLESGAYDLLTSELDSEGGASLRQVLEAMQRDESDVQRITLNGEEHFIAYAPMQEVGGSFAVVAPVAEITADSALITGSIDDDANRTLLVTLLAMLGIFVAGLIGATYLNRRALLRPLHELGAATRRVAGGDLTAEVRLDRGDELGQLADDFNVMVDQVRASERELEQRVEDRTRELAGLVEITRVVSSTLQVQPLLQLVLEQTASVLPYDRSVMMLRDGEELEILAVRAGVGEPDETLFRQVGMRLPVERTRVLWDALEQGEPLIIGDAHSDEPMAAAFREEVGAFTGPAVSEFRSWMGIPLMTKSSLAGVMTVARGDPHVYGERHAALGRAIASQVAIAIDNARLFEEAAQQARETETLVRADAELFRSLDLDTVLRALTGVAVEQLGADKSAVALHEGEVDRVRAARNFSEASVNWFNEAMSQFPHEEPDPADERPRIATPETESTVPISEMLIRENIKSMLLVPVRDSARMLGVFSIGFVDEHTFNDDEIRMYQALADRAAVAIQNAELYEQAQMAASLEERQRLARELHDSVSQALYGIALGTRTARLRLGEDPHNAAEPIDYVASLAQAGLAEMRALIFELRPESLEQEGIVAAIEKQVASIGARYKLDIATELGDEPACSLDTKEALYRIAQEALHNVVKHARATHVDVHLHTNADTVELTIADDGRGFDASGAYPGHVGLLSMPERARKLGGTVNINSAAGEGTRVVARLPL